jgi:signal transduction histidine kinase
VIRDVTVHKQSEAELERARDEALDASRLKSAFVANMSHELRTPLNGVMGMSELLATTLLTERQARYNEMLMRSAESLLRIVNELLDFADLEAGTLALERGPTAIRELVRQVVNHAVTQTDERQVVVEALVDADTPETVTADPLRLRQIVMHLVGNALKFTSDGQVLLHVDVTRDGDGLEMLRFRVSDTGIGIDADLLAAIFAPFNQADVSSTRRFGDTGIGLTISRKLAEMMGGVVTASSEPGRGSTFTLLLPLVPVDQAPAQTTSPPIAAAAAMQDSDPAAMR